MFRCKTIFPLLLFSVLPISEIRSETGYKSEILISCVPNDSAEEFKTFAMRYHPDMKDYTHKFDEIEMEMIHGLVGNREKIIFFILGFEDKLYSSKGNSFRVAKVHAQNTKAAICTISYSFINGNAGAKNLMYLDALKQRLPIVVNMASYFIKSLIDSPTFNIQLSSVYLTGFCLGGHIAGHVGHALKGLYDGKQIPAIWAFDPPHMGFPLNKPSDKSVPRRVQKGDAQFVVVFHTSKLGVQENEANVDIKVNDGVAQPGCERIFDKLKEISCSHFAGFILRELIIQNPEDLEVNNDNMPIARNEGNKSDIIVIDFLHPPKGKSGIYNMVTGKVFET